MLWALLMQSRKQYSQHVKESFHLTMASLDVSKADDHPIQVMVIFGGGATRYLLCTLDKKNVWQVPLDLHIEKGTFVTLSCNGIGHVHLTGYYKNPKLNDPDATIGNIISAHIMKGVTTLDQLEKCLKRKKKLEYQIGPYGNWMVQRINTEEENEENEREANSKRKANSRTDEAAKRMKLSANFNENRSNNDDNCDHQNIKNLDDDVNYDEDEDGSDDDYDGYYDYRHYYNDEDYDISSSCLDSDDDKIKTQNKENEDKVTEEGANGKQKDKKKMKQQVKLPYSLKVMQLKSGTGKVAEVGKYVTIHYVARVLLGSRTPKIDQCSKGCVLRFKLGAGYVPRGVDIGTVGMKVGEKRRLIIPPRLGYGSRGSEPSIPPYSTLMYDVELKKVE